MRYLNKIVFINSATIPYAEIQLDGNIHFIGTQGVGKSTVLRAILYFYNADSRKLGIPKGPTVKSFADWYLSYGNSYVVYEVMRETGAYCVVAYKSQNRVCFRFIDTPYNPDYFLNENRQALTNWDTIREKLDKHRINVSTMVNSYDQYRDILYGNFTGKKEFKKYALLEAKQYRNIYRTIQNVFLNTKLDANEIKQTIISSMEDEHIAIDLDQYSHHLQGFETEINDIRCFRFPSVRKQATNATEALSAIRHLKREQNTLASHLKYRLETIENEKPALNEQRVDKKNSLQAELKQRDHETALFEKRKARINDSVSRLSGKLKDAAKRRKYYDSININELIRRVATNEEKKLEVDSLKNQRMLLTNEYSDINNKYAALINEQDHQLSAFIHQKEMQKVEIEKAEVEYIADLNSKYEKIFLELDKEHETELKHKEEELTRRKDDIHELEKKKVALKHKRFYEQEISQVTETINNDKLALKEETNNIESYKKQIETLQTKWQYEKSEAEQNSDRQKEKLQLKYDSRLKQKLDIEDKIEKSKDSLYGWLNKNKPGWESTIGKVIDEELLFKADLSPKLADNSTSIYGLEINLNEVELKIKTIDDYQFELGKLNKKLEQYQHKFQKLETGIEKEIENIQRRNLPKIKELKERVRQAEFQCEQLSHRINKGMLDKGTLTDKATTEKQQAIAEVQVAIDKAIVLKEEARENYEASKSKLQKSKAGKQREKSRLINEAKALNKEKMQELLVLVDTKHKQVNAEITNIKVDRDKELANKGADTSRLAEIERNITTVQNELDFIEKHRDQVSDYNKDKRELFDLEKDFKNEIKLYEKQLEHLQHELSVLLAEFSKKIEQIKLEIEAIEVKLTGFERDEEKYNDFIGSSAFKVVADIMAVIDAAENNKTAIQIIGEITDKNYLGKDKQEELKTSIDKFLSRFSDGNILKFPSKLIGIDEYLRWAEELNDFIEDDKISEIEKRTNERFADIVGTIGRETTTLISKTGEIKKIINKINADFTGKKFLEAVTNIELDIKDSKNTAVMLLKKIKEFNDENAFSLGAADLFSNNDQDKNNKKAVELLKQLVKEINTAQRSSIELTDSFELTFRVQENGNDTGWVEKLTNVGSEGTDVLVKAMINIMLLNVFKEGASRKFKDFKLHCMMDEVGKLHPNNVKGILNFANDRNILLINGSPTESTPLNYRHIYKMRKDDNMQSKILRIVSNPN